MSEHVRVLVWAGFVVWATFCLWYHVRATWWRSPEGRNIMGVAAAVTALLGLIAAQASWPGYALRPWVQTIIYGVIPVLGLQRLAQLERRQREAGHMSPVPRTALAARIKAAWRYVNDLEPVYVTTVWRAVVVLLGTVGLTVGSDLDGAVVAAIGAAFVLLDTLQSKASRKKSVPVAKLPASIVELAKDGPLPGSPAADAQVMPDTVA